MKKSGGQWISFCPAHDDKNEPSLSFKEGNRSELVATCHVGCTFEAILAALGLDASLSGASDFESRIETTYDYTSEEGELLYQAVRLRSPKDFRQRRPDGDGWSWKLGAVRRVLYRLPAVREAADARRSVFIVEGEKDADTLHALGLVATCSPMGASKSAESSKWRNEFSASLAGVPLAIVIGDCDEAGRAHARATCISLHAAGVPVRLVDLASDRDDGYDAYDLVAEHGEGARGELERRVREAPLWPLTAGWDSPIISVKEFEARVGPYDNERDYLGALLRGGERLHVIGPIGHGKTTFQTEAVRAALAGEEFLGFQGRGGLRALYIDLEQAEHTLVQELRSARLLRRDDFDLWHQPEGLEIDRNERHRKELDRWVAGYDIVVIDPWYKLIAEELSEGMRNARTVIAVLDGIKVRHPKAAVMVGFHANEPQDGKQTLMLGNASGFKVFQRNCETAITFQRQQGGRDRSTVVWAKARSEFLPKLGTKWTVEWERGAGFRRVERQKPTDILHALLASCAEWRDYYDLADELGWSRNHVSEVAQRVVYEGRAQERKVGRRTEVRAMHADQETLI